ncbi:Uncharacterised protein [Bordetella pertussis]|nr:Uncharacterised protein [Bordetella pertussis]
MKREWKPWRPSRSARVKKPVCERGSFSTASATVGRKPAVTASRPRTERVPVA